MPFDELSLLACAAYIVDNRGRSCPVGDAGRPLIATNCLREGGLYPTYETTRFVSDETYKTWFRGHPMPGDLIFVTKGSPGRVCLAPNPVDFCIAQDMVAIRADEKKVYPKYLFAVLRSDEVQRRISNMHVGTLIPHFKKGDFDKLLLPIPPRQEQVFIGDVYFEISSRIDLLRSTNVTLESIAQALFKSWFIDFDPVRAKAEGREPEGMDAATAALFPAEFEESALGLIPKGWRVGCLGEVLTPRPSRTKASDLTACLPYVPIECITAKSVFLRESLPGEQAQSSLTLFKEGDILFGAMRPYFHKVCIAPFDGVTRTTAFVLKAEHKAFALFAAFEDSTIEYATTHSEGSTIPYAKWTGSLERKALTLPPSELLDLFEKVIVPVLEAGIQNTRRMQTLARIRDELLPRLISGKLRLPEAQEQVEDAVA
jgi:type I restriction enzyme, S subunit